MASSGPEIKMLLEAEKFAQDLIKQARSRKAMRMNQARTEAELEIKQFQTELEQQVKDQASSDKSGADTELVEIQAKTTNDIATMNENVATHKAEVIKTLLDIVCTVTPKVHINYVK
eukprot:m.256271 g.256271  ORF g.256271 m.256271 type:complete len:117 (-) comp34217_c0_seq1:399-749(-)